MVVPYPHPHPHLRSPYPWHYVRSTFDIQPKPLTFVLIHGAWADASFWNEIAAELRQLGHTVYAPEYAGHGADPNKAVTHAMITQSVVDFIVSHNLQNIILVGHSFGGSVVQKVAEQIPDRIRRMVFWNAFVLKDGEAVADELPPPVREMFEQIRKNSPNDTIPLPFPVFRENFVNTASNEFATHMYQQTPAEPAVPLFEKLDLKKFYSLTTPRSYVNLTEDTAIPPQADGSYGWHPHMSSRLGLYRYIQGIGDHMSTAKTDPRMVAFKIYEAGRD